MGRGTEGTRQLIYLFLSDTNTWPSYDKANPSCRNCLPALVRHARVENLLLFSQVSNDDCGHLEGIWIDLNPPTLATSFITRSRRVQIASEQALVRQPKGPIIFHHPHRIGA